MNFEKEIKKQIIVEASSHPEKYFPVKALKEFGMQRQKCQNCQIMFWSVEKRKICGDTNCVKQYSFIGNSPSKIKMEFAQTYHLFQQFLEKRGYHHVNNFPIVARWRNDLDFTIASIIGFQPYVTKGIIKPQFELLTIAQNCLRFSDIDNVGYTGRHGTNFVMIGQCAFKESKDFDQNKYIKDLFEWFTVVMQIPKNKIQIHEDAWSGGGDCGPSLEFFSCGLELANQVYMLFDITNAKSIKDLKPLKIKVLDMGMGLERVCWFSKGSLNQYEATMPEISDYLFKKTKINKNNPIYLKFLPYSGLLNIDEIEDIEKEWKNISNKINIKVEKLKEEIEPIVGVYCILDHTRTLLYALSDGALPSNVKGGYNLRIILRRALDFIYKYNWDIDLYEIIELQAKYTSKLFPSLLNELSGIKKIIENEVIKYHKHKQEIDNKLKNLLKNKNEFTIEEYLKYYISLGITPVEIQKYYKKKDINLEIPNNFFSEVTKYFENTKNKDNLVLENKFEKYLQNIRETELLFYKDSYKKNLNVKILKIFEHEDKKYIILDKTLFYPTMGGQEHDTGFIGNFEVINVIKIKNIILHEIK